MGFMLKNGEHISPKQCLNMRKLRLRLSPRKWLDIAYFWWNKSVINTPTNSITQIIDFTTITQKHVFNTKAFAYGIIQNDFRILFSVFIL